jgi:HEAT repeat protein
MPGFLRRFSFDQLSFWIGFLTGILFIWFFGKVRPLLNQLWAAFQSFTAQTRHSLSAGTESRYLADVLQLAQHAHLAATLFSLDEVLIEPRILAPPNWPSSGGENQPAEAASKILPYLPDWPELGTNFGAPTLTLTQALEGGANLILLGHPGAGKTVALAGLASQIARRAPQVSAFSDFIPVFVHVAELDPEKQTECSPFEILTAAVLKQVSSLTAPRLPALLEQAAHDGRILLLLDGVDELPPREVDASAKYVRGLLKTFSKIRVLVAASPEYYGGFTRLGFLPVAMAAWSHAQKEWFIRNWSDLWEKFVPRENQANAKPVDPLLLTGWLLQENTSGSPLEFTLHTWAAFAGDALGPKPADAFEAFLRRATVNIPGALEGLGELALDAVESMHPMIRLQSNREESPTSQEQQEDQSAQAPPEPASTERKQAAVARMVPEIVDQGILTERAGGRITFKHPSLLGYLAARSLGAPGDVARIVKQADWAGKSSTLQFLASNVDASQLVNYFLSQEADPLQRKPLAVGRWLRDAPKESSWRPQAMRYLASLVQREDLSVSLRARALIALANSGESGVITLFRKLAASEKADIRLIGVLGLGMCSDAKTVVELQALLEDPHPLIRQAACLSLVSVGTIPALEAVAGALLQGEEDVRRAAAEALANHPEEGHPVLVDGSTVEDLLVRRAVVFGLAKIREPWAIQILEKMQIEDGQWVVRNAATQALEEIARPDPRLPRPRPSLSETPWLIAFAGEKGIGISPGKPAEGLLIKALAEGTDEQRIAALDRLGLLASKEAIPGIYQVLANGHGDLREAAFNSLWHMAAAGVDLPPVS